MERIIDLWQNYSYVYIDGLVGTVLLALITMLLSTIFGLIVALLRLSKRKTPVLITSSYVWLIRGTPILLQLYFFWLVLPRLLTFEIKDETCILLALVVNATAFISEVIRSGIQAVDKGQLEAGKSLGMSGFNIFKKIIFPQAFKNILPALGNEYIAIMKETSLASVFFVLELTTAYKTVQSASFLPIPSLIISGLIYLMLVAMMSKFFGRMEGRLSS